MHKAELWSSLCIFLPLMGLTETISTKVGSQNAHKIPNFKYPLSIENGLPFYDETHPLLMNCSITFLIYMIQMRGASLCILLPLMGLTKLCSTKVDSQIAQNTRCWVHPLSAKMACRSKRRDIHCLWSVLQPYWDACDWWEELSKHLSINYWSHWAICYQDSLSKFNAKCHILDSLSVYKMRCWTARRDIHCWWSVSKPSLDALSRWEELPCASFRNL